MEEIINKYNFELTITNARGFLIRKYKDATIKGEFYIVGTNEQFKSPANQKFKVFGEVHFAKNKAGKDIYNELFRTLKLPNKFNTEIVLPGYEATFSYTLFGFNIQISVSIKTWSSIHILINAKATNMASTLLATKLSAIGIGVLAKQENRPIGV